MKKILPVLIVFIFCLTVFLNQISTEAVAGSEGDMPAPQLVRDAWMFIAAYKADPKALKELLPPGLEPNPEGQVVINMYTVPDPNQTSGFGAYTLTYLTVELKDLGSELSPAGGGHLNYFGLISAEQSGESKNQVVKYPIPWSGGVVETTNAKIKFKAPRGNSLRKIKPKADPTWAVWMKGSFVYPQYQVISEF